MILLKILLSEMILSDMILALKRVVVKVCRDCRFSLRILKRKILLSALSPFTIRAVSAIDEQLRYLTRYQEEPYSCYHVGESSAQRHFTYEIGECSCQVLPNHLTRVKLSPSRRIPGCPG